MADFEINVELNDEVQSLINTVNTYFDGQIEVAFVNDVQSGYVRHDQAIILQSDKHIQIQIADISAPNYTASHELLHLLMALKGFPQVRFALTTNDHNLDNQLKIMGTELYDIVAHLVVVKEQRAHNLINAEIEAMYLKGIYATLTKETGEIDDQMLLRLSTLLDARVFYGAGIDQVEEQLAADFPIAFAASAQLYEIITNKETSSAFSLRRNVVKLFKAFDEQLQQWQLPTLHNTEFATVESVLSKRQLGLNVKQVFEVFHSELVDEKTKRRAYVGFNRTDNQNAFVIPAPKNEKDSPAFFRDIYAKTVKELFEELQIPYIVRD